MNFEFKNDETTSLLTLYSTVEKCIIKILLKLNDLDGLDFIQHYFNSGAAIKVDINQIRIFLSTSYCSSRWLYLVRYKYQKNDADRELTSKCEK